MESSFMQLLPPFKDPVGPLSPYNGHAPPHWKALRCHFQGHKGTFLSTALVVRKPEGPIVYPPNPSRAPEMAGFCRSQGL